MRFALTAMALAASIVAQPALGKTIIVQMKNAGSDTFMVFEPAFIRANVGDVVHFNPANSGHNAQTIDGMLPDGVAPSAGKMSQPFDLKISKPGLYGIKCAPHFSMGMVALIKAGNGPAANAQKAKTVKLPPLAAKRMSVMLGTAN